MRPPICAVCGERGAAAGMTLVRFSDYEPLPDGKVGHPNGLEWFCGEHEEAAEASTHLTSRQAIRRVRLSSSLVTPPELISLALASLVPALGVLFFGWDARAIAFVMTAEVIVLSAVLGWLFNYPARSTASAVLFVALLAPTGFLMAALVSRGTGESLLGSATLGLAKTTWISLLAIAWAGVVVCRGQMARARKQGATIRTNNALLIRWLLQVFTPFLVLVALMVLREAFSPVGLAVLLGTKALVDVILARGSAPLTRRS